MSGRRIHIGAYEINRSYEGAKVFRKRISWPWIVQIAIIAVAVSAFYLYWFFIRVQPPQPPYP